MIIKEIGDVTGWLRKTITVRSIQVNQHHMFQDVERCRLHSNPAPALGVERGKAAGPGFGVVYSARPRMISKAWSISPHPSVSNSAHLMFCPGDRRNRSYSWRKTTAERNNARTR